MTLGVIMLVHTALARAAQVAQHWAASGCPVVIHVDRRVSRAGFDRFAQSLAHVPHLEVISSNRCEWGTWGIVAATQAASTRMLTAFPQVRHVLLTSGSCLPLRPAKQLQDYLSARPETDFIESATISDVRWTMGGLDAERFSLSYPFAWKKNRALFDRYVQLQRFFGRKRGVPVGIVPHMGSQWWCLSRQTLSAILEDTDRAAFERYFRKVWIPDESYFQTLARRHSTSIESRSLTLSKFDYQGKPHIFYDDHLQLLQRSDCFVARKIWPKADQLYDVFLNEPIRGHSQSEPNPGKIDRVFSQAVERRMRGRRGLYMQSRRPKDALDTSVTAAPYWVFHGFAELFEDFENWLAKASGACVHGHLFAPDRAHFANGQTEIGGALSDSAKLRDYRPQDFLTNLIWNTRGERQCFQFSATDHQAISPCLAKDNNAHVSMITGAWAVPLFHSNEGFDSIRQEAARLQKIEARHIETLRAGPNEARIRLWSMAEFVHAPMDALQDILDDLAPNRPRRVAEVPRMRDLSGFGKFLQRLKNQGMHPYLTGHFPVDPSSMGQSGRPAPRPYLVR